MLKFVDRILDTITMYRLVLYVLIGLVAIALVYGFVGLLPYNPFALMFTTLALLAVCWATNTLFARVLEIPTNVESVYISALILALIITPLTTLTVHDLVVIGWVGVWAMASKYVLAINRKHLFNPVAFAVALTALTINETASWWVANLPMLPFVALGGFLIVRKTRRFELVWAFLLASLGTSLFLAALNGGDLWDTLQQTVIYSPLVFFASLILTEPLTIPPTRTLQMIYGALVGVLFSPLVHLGSLYLTPELAILVGNVFSYIVSPKARLVLRLKQKIQIAPDVYDFIFTPDRKLSFASGQYMEWTLAHNHPDSRGNRRYFTLASAPTENNLRLGVKFYARSSSFKQSMLAMDDRTEIIAGQLAGDFVLPENRRQHCVFIAGGIGITPFRSMLKYLLDSNQKRPITLFYTNKTADEIVYQDVLDKAHHKLGIRTVYTLTDQSQVPPTWTGHVGRITPQMLQQEVPDYGRCLFYLSGPNAMVTATEEMLVDMGVKREQIKTDFFPGLV